MKKGGKVGINTAGKARTNNVSKHKLNKTSTPLLCVYSIFAFIYFYLFLRGFINHLSMVPFWDEWDSRVDFITQLKLNGPIQFFATHNEHRPTITYILFTIDYFLFRGSGIFLLLCNLAFLAILSIQVFRFFLQSRVNNFTKIQKIVLFSVWLIPFTSLVGYENLYWANQSCFYLTVILPLLTFQYCSGLEFDSKKSKKYLVIFLAVSSTLTLANGLSVPFILGIIAIFLLRDRLLGSVVSILGIAIYLLYTNSNSSIQQGGNRGPIYEALHEPIMIVNYLVKYFQGPIIIGSNNNKIAVLIWSILFLYLLFYFFAHVGKVEKNLKVYYMGSVAYLLISALGIAAGRSFFGVNQALASRYTILSMTTFVILATFRVARISEKSRKNHNPNFTSTLLVIGLVLIAALWPAQVNKSKLDIGTQTQRTFAQFLLKNSILDEPTLSAIHPSPTRLEYVSKPFRNSKYFNFGNPILSSATFNIRSLNDNICTSTISDNRVATLNNQYQIIYGTYNGFEKRNTPEKIFLLDIDGNTVGWGFVGIENTSPSLASGAIFTSFLAVVKVKDLNKVHFIDGYSSSCRGQIG
jgi:hypothetical protein